MFMSFKNRLNERHYISLLHWPCTSFTNTESKFLLLIYDLIGRNMFLNLLVVVSRILQYFVMFY